jgi:RNA polymerase sigma-70 factor (ECF subfamily)
MNSATVTAPLDPPSDRDLLIRLGDGDRRAGDQLQRRMEPCLRKFFASKVIAADNEDLVQQVWVALGETLRRSPNAHPQLSVRAYILGIARHVLFRWIRSRYRAEQPDPIHSSIAQLEPSLSQIVGDKLAAERMIRALQQLPLETQVLLEFRYTHEMTVPEIAALHSIPEGTVKSRLARARAELEQLLSHPER